MFDFFVLCFSVCLDLCILIILIIWTFWLFCLLIGLIWYVDVKYFVLVCVCYNAGGVWCLIGVVVLDWFLTCCCLCLCLNTLVVCWLIVLRGDELVVLYVYFWLLLFSLVDSIDGFGFGSAWVGLTFLIIVGAYAVGWDFVCILNLFFWVCFGFALLC